MATTWYKRIGRMHVPLADLFALLGLPDDAAIRDAALVDHASDCVRLTIEHDSLPEWKFNESVPIVSVKDGKLVMPYGV